MAGQNVTSFQGNLIAGPPKTSSSMFPAGLVNISFGLKPSSKPGAASTKGVRNLTANSYVTLHGIGPGEDVTQANFLFVQSDASFLLRITYDDGNGGDIVSVIPVNGLFASEAPDDKFIKLLEAQGTGVVEYFASGNR